MDVGYGTGGGYDGGGYGTDPGSGACHCACV
jgi:hypothetical protein